MMKFGVNWKYVKKQKRQSNIELLRIIAMVMMVAHHFAYHGNFEFSTKTITLNRLWISFIEIGGKIGVDIFVLISGYFLVGALRLKVDKLIKIWLQMITYSVVIFIIFTVFKFESFSIKELINRIFPVTFSHWWFASTYFVLYLFSPYINIFLRSLDKKRYQKLLILLTFCWCIIPTFLVRSWQCNDLLWFFYLYSLAGYIKINASKSRIKSQMYFAMSAGMTVLVFLSVIVLDFIGKSIPICAAHATFFYDMKRFPILFIAIFMFMGFLNINVRYSSAINTIASATFGVFLIHDDRYVRSFLWNTVFKNASFQDSDILIPYSIFVIAIVYITCMLIELLRLYLFEKRYMPIVKKTADSIKLYLDKFISLSFFDRI